MNRLFSLIRERARGKMADDSAADDSVAKESATEERIVEDSATDDAMAEKLATASSTTGEAIAEIAAVKELASGGLVTADVEVAVEPRTVLEQSSVVEQSQVQSITEAIVPTEDKQSQELLYGIVIHNDSETTFDYVIHILTYYFLLSREMAEHIADVTHREGASLALLRPYEEAQYLIKIAHMKAELDGYPLRFSLEEPDEELAVCRSEPEREI